MRRSEQICNTAEAADHERHHLIQVFQSNGYPKAFIRRAMNPKWTSTKDKQAVPLTTISIPYIKGTNESIRQCLSQVDIWVAFRSRRSLMRVRPQQSPMGWSTKYHAATVIKCTLGRQGDIWSQKIKERQIHCKYGDTDKYAVALHTWTNNHCIDWDSSSVIDREGRLPTV